MSNSDIVVKIMYYTFTTLSTVGFGDMRPVSSIERLVCAFIMFFGVMIFSLVIGLFLQIIERFKKIDEELGDSSQLITFFSVLEQKNKNKRFNIRLQE